MQYPHDSKPDKATRWQFRLIWLFVATLAVAFCCTLWIADSADWSIVTSWALSVVLPASSVSGAIYFRGYRRAFFVGMAVTQVIYAMNAVVDFEYFLSRVTGIGGVWPEPISEYSHGFARRTVIVIGLSVLSGLLATSVRWFAIKTNKPDPRC